MSRLGDADHCNSQLGCLARTRTYGIGVERGEWRRPTFDNSELPGGWAFTKHSIPLSPNDSKTYQPRLGS